MRAAVVGAGLMGRWHARELARAGGVVAAVADRDGSAARRLAADHPGARCFSDLPALLEATGPEVVHVCTPTASHAPLAAAALAAGAHVLVEKPMAPDLRLTAELVELAERHDRLVCPVHQYLFQPPLRTVGASLARIGPLRDLAFLACSAGAATAPGPASAAEVAADILPHGLGVLHRVLPGGLDGLRFASAALSPGEIAALGSADGVAVRIRVSMAGRPTRNELQVIGDRGTLHLDFYHGLGFVRTGRDSRADKVVQPFRFAGRLTWAAGVNLSRRSLRREPAYPGLRSLIDALYRHVHGDGPAPITHQEGLAVARAREQLLEASNELTDA